MGYPHFDVSAHREVDVVVEWLTVERAAPGPLDPLPEMDRWWEHIGRTLGRDWDLSASDKCPSAVDVVVTDHAYLFAILLPGVRADELVVEVREHDLRPNGTRVRRSRLGVILRPVEGGYHYCATLPASVDAAGIDAWLLDGVAVVRVPVEHYLNFSC
jgi:HSP20 family molecular chaperone IbpA